jgi:hypothetical protein
MNGGGGTLAFRPTWLQLNEAIAILVERGVKREVAKKSLRRAIASGTRVSLQSTGGPLTSFAGALRYRVHTEFRHYVGSKWWAQSQLNFPASTIEVPSGGDPGSSDEFEIKPRWQLIEIWAGDIEHLWPVPSAISEGSGATIGHESAAVKALASHLKIEKQLTRDEAAEWLGKSGYKLGKRAFQRVWTEARGQAGLPRLASPGRKPKTRQ